MGHINDMPDTTVAQVAKQAGIGKATVFRMLNEFGYRSFSEFKQDIILYIEKNTPPAYWQVQKMMRSEGISSNALNDVLKYTAFSLDMFNNQELLDTYSRVVDLMEHAPEIGVLGCRTSSILAQYFESSLLPTPINVINLTNNELFVFDRIIKLNKKAVIFVLARWPYTALTIKAAEYAQSLGHDVVLLTNHDDCKAGKFASEIIITPHVEKCYSIIPFVVVIEAITNELYMRTFEHTSEQLDTVNHTLEQQKLLIW